MINLLFFQFINIILIEKDLCGSGASGRNGGCMIPQSTKFQGIKKGINELANLIIITKDDGDNQEKVKETMLDYNSIMSLNIKTDANSIPKVFKCSSHENTGIEEINIATKQYIQRSKENDIFNIKN